jgi:hypothetical protein
MNQAQKTFTTDAFIERACILLMLLLSTVTIIACIGLHKIYGFYNEAKLIGVPVLGAILYIVLSLANKNMGFTRFIKETVSPNMDLTQNTINRMIRAIKLSVLVTITFKTIVMLENAYNIHTDMQELSSIVETMLVVIPLMYVLVQLYRARTAD